MKITLTNQLKSVKVQFSKIMQSYFTRVSQIKEKMESISDMIEEAEVVMTTLNGISREWESFIQGMRSKRNLMKF